MVACDGDKRKAMSLYRYNLQLSLEMFGIISYFEIILRNAINECLRKSLGPNWLRDAVLPGGVYDSKSSSSTANIILKIYRQLVKENKYTHTNLLSNLDFGIWKYHFANPQYRATNHQLLSIFPNKPRSTKFKQYNNSFIFNELDSINRVRNRIAHHEPICFHSQTSLIDCSFIRNLHTRVLVLMDWMDVDSKRFLEV